MQLRPATVFPAALRTAAAFLVLAPALLITLGIARRSVTPSPVPVVVSLHELPASRAAAIIRGFYPNLRVRVDAHANAVIAIAPPEEADAIRTILQGIDVRSPDSASVDAEVLHNVSPAVVLGKLRAVFHTARFFVAPKRTLITVASPDDLEQIKTVIAAIDTPLQTPTPRPRYPAVAVRITQRNVRQVALAVAHSAPDVAVAISGSEILLRGRSLKTIRSIPEPKASRITCFIRMAISTRRVICSEAPRRTTAPHPRLPIKRTRSTRTAGSRERRTALVRPSIMPTG
jgi:hypothetical protein